MTNSAVSDAFTSAEPTFPLYYSHYENGMYYYVTSCCLDPVHYGLLVSLYPIPPNELGCAVAIPITGPGVITEEVIIPISDPENSEAATAPPTPVFAARLTANGNIRDSDPLSKVFHINPIGITKGPARNVSFIADNSLVDGRTYQLRMFEFALCDGSGNKIEYHVANFVDDALSPNPIPLRDVDVSSAFEITGITVVSRGRLIAGTFDDGGVHKPMFIVNHVG